MSYPSMAIIGTAGRKEDQHLLRASHYERMVNAAVSLIDHTKCDRSTLQLISGGAAWADHIVVTLALSGVVNPSNVTLFLPSNLTSHGFSGVGDLQSRTASTANYYHQLFSGCVKLNSIAEIIELGKRGGILLPGNGNFHARNAMVAKSVTPDGALLAFTSGDPAGDQLPWTIKSFYPQCKASEAGLKDGGTAHTWDNATCRKYHCKLGRMPSG
jgi:hypothetical protein